MGPTACGKTSLAVRLVERFPVAIVSVDSALVYRGMDIGSAKPDVETLRRAPHRMVDVRDPWKPYSASDFAQDAMQEIAAIRADGLVPILVGGTGLYFRAIEGGLSRLPGADPKVRAEIEREAQVNGWQAMHRLLSEVDPGSASKIFPNDRQRIQRALEVFRISGRPLSELQKVNARDVQAPLAKIALLPKDRRSLWPLMEQRFLAMLEDGLIEEVRKLYEDPRFDAALPAMRSVGYRQVIEHLDGAYGREEMISRALAATRQLAKRQMTWLRKEPGLSQIWLEDGDVTQRAIDEIARIPLIQEL